MTRNLRKFFSQTMTQNIPTIKEYENFVKVLNQLSADDLRHLLDELDTDEDFDETDFED